MVVVQILNWFLFLLFFFNIYDFFFTYYNWWSTAIILSCKITIFFLHYHNYFKRRVLMKPVTLPVNTTLIQFKLFTVASLVCTVDVDSAHTNLLLTTPMTFNFPVAGSDQRSGPPESTWQELTLGKYVHSRSRSVVSNLYLSVHWDIGVTFRWDFWREPDTEPSKLAVPQPDGNKYIGLRCEKEDIYQYCRINI